MRRLKELTMINEDYMQDLKALYQQHIEENQRRTREVLARESLDYLVIHSGTLPKIKNPR